MTIRPQAVVAVTMLLTWSTNNANAAPPVKRVDFNRDIRPILSDVCFECHGPDANQRKAELRLDTKDGVFRSKDDVTNVVAGKPAESELYLRVVSTDPEERMPPPKFGKQLAKEQTELIRLWIEQGAEFKGHWAFIPPTRPDLPVVTGPRATGQPPFLRTPIDYFILAELREHGLSPNPEADRITLARRLSFDLTGLPPTVAEVDAFVNDQSPDAYEKLVDRLLASPHFGERLALHWLDLVRFADTAGYHSDNPRDIVPYRDYVIRSFNANLPFDQFTREQLAGDLLPSPSIWQKVASGYNRLLQTTEEGGAQAKEYIAKYAADRVRNVSSVWLGATMGCCECHDHKFDPFSQRDFYSLAAFFADVQETAVGRREPGLPVPSEEDEKQLAKFDEQLAAARKRLDDAVAALVASHPNWEQELGTKFPWTVLDPVETKVQGESQLHQQPDGSYKSSGKAAAQETYVLTFKADLRRHHAPRDEARHAERDGYVPITGFRLEVLTDDELPAKGPGLAPNGNFVLTEVKVAALADGKPPQPVKLARAVADHSQSGHDIATAIDGKDPTGWAVLPQIGQPHEAVFELEKPLAGEGAKCSISLEFKSQFPQHGIGRLRIGATSASQPASQWVSPAVRDALAAAPDKRNDAQKTLIVAYLRDQSVKFQPLREDVQKLQTEREEIAKRLPASLVTVSAAPRMVRMLPRGNWLDESGDAVEPAIPASLGKLNNGDRRATRLDLANWLVSNDNPLPTRVFVNRLWKLYFGQGLSKSLEDFGAQGEWPTHPELLDWLAVEFRVPAERVPGWNVKHLVKLIVTSGSYRQTSTLSQPSRAADPYNRLLSAQGRFRLDAEFIRDNALAISGLLSRRIGGESDKPYQPDGYWDYLNFPRRTWEHDKGERQYRRGLYTFWQRSFLHPSLLAFDAPSREECVADRPRSNTPQQALTLLNDPSYVEAARVFASRILKEGGATDDDRLRWAFRQALSRPPKLDELSILAKLLAKHRDEFRKNATAAEQLPKIGETPAPDGVDKVEVAAWTSIARTIFNLHETITRL